MEIKNEHELKASYAVDLFYINEPEPRKASPIFMHMKREADKADTRCAISGQPKLQYHHFFCEYAGRDQIDWHTVKGVATGAIDKMPVLDLKTHRPIPGLFFPAKDHLLYKLYKFAEICFSMDWQAFNPDDPVSFVDSINNMLPLNEKFHIRKDHGIHLMPLPEFLLQVFPRIDGLILTSDEIEETAAA